MNSEKFPRGALYVRMSTDHQRYSITHQTTCLRAYAEEHGIQIIKVYEDAGKSGLTFAGRPGLRALISDVSSGLAEFNTLLVYDVSRWGRFQDVDESAYHEYTCRMAGIRIVYCEEPFENDGSGISSIVKSLKRVMAGEYSRELSRKVYTSKRRLASNGHRQGGPAPFGLDRYTLDADGNHHGPLGFGEQKHRITDRVVLRPGAPREVSVVRSIFALYDLGYNGAEIATHLNASGIKSPRQLSWRGQAVMGILRNDAYVGVSVWGKTTSKLMSRTLTISREKWIVADDAFEGIIDKALFARVRQRIESTEHIIHSTPYLIQCLRRLGETGPINAARIKADPLIPSVSTFYERFGGMKNMRELAGAGCASSYLIEIAHRSKLRKLRSLIIHDIRKLTNARTIRSSRREGLNRLQFASGTTLSVVIARQQRGPRGPFWRLQVSRRHRTDYVLLICPAASGEAIERLYLVDWSHFNGCGHRIVGPNTAKRLSSQQFFNLTDLPFT